MKVRCEHLGAVGRPVRQLLASNLLGLPRAILLCAQFFATLARWLHWPIPGSF
jgi:hypothetical protein